VILNPKFLLKKLPGHFDLYVEELVTEINYQSCPAFFISSKSSPNNDIRSVSATTAAKFVDQYESIDSNIGQSILI
jgi:predicted nucleic acid-binding Zn finger protein